MLLKNGAVLGRVSVTAVIFKIILYRRAKEDLNYSGHETSIITQTKKDMKLTSFE